MCKGVRGLKASTQECVGFSIETANSDIGKGTTSGHKTLPVGGGSDQGVGHHPSNLLSGNGVPHSGGEARWRGRGGGRLGGAGLGILMQASSGRQAAGIAHKLLCQQGPSRGEIGQSL